MRGDGDGEQDGRGDREPVHEVYPRREDLAETPQLDPETAIPECSSQRSLAALEEHERKTCICGAIVRGCSRTCTVYEIIFSQQVCSTKPPILRAPRRV